MTHQERFSLETTGHRHMHDITASVANIVKRSGIRTGWVQVFHKCDIKPRTRGIVVTIQGE